MVHLKKYRSTPPTGGVRRAPVTKAGTPPSPPAAGHQSSTFSKDDLATIIDDLSDELFNQNTSLSSFKGTTPGPAGSPSASFIMCDALQARHPQLYSIGERLEVVRNHVNSLHVPIGPLPVPLHGAAPVATRSNSSLDVLSIEALSVFDRVRKILLYSKLVTIVPAHMQIVEPIVGTDVLIPVETAVGNYSSMLPALISQVEAFSRKIRGLPQPSKPDQSVDAYAVTFKQGIDNIFTSVDTLYCEMSAALGSVPGVLVRIYKQALDDSFDVDAEAAYIKACVDFKHSLNLVNMANKALAKITSDLGKSTAAANAATAKLKSATIAYTNASTVHTILETDLATKRAAHALSNTVTTEQDVKDAEKALKTAELDKQHEKTLYLQAEQASNDANLKETKDSDKKLIDDNQLSVLNADHQRFTTEKTTTYAKISACHMCEEILVLTGKLVNYPVAKPYIVQHPRVFPKGVLPASNSTGVALSPVEEAYRYAMMVFENADSASVVQPVIPLDVVSVELLKTATISFNKMMAAKEFCDLMTVAEFKSLEQQAIAFTSGNIPTPPTTFATTSSLDEFCRFGYSATVLSLVGSVIGKSSGRTCGENAFAGMALVLDSIVQTVNNVRCVITGKLSNLSEYSPLGYSNHLTDYPEVVELFNLKLNVTNVLDEALYDSIHDVTLRAIKCLGCYVDKLSEILNSGDAFKIVTDIYTLSRSIVTLEGVLVHILSSLAVFTSISMDPLRSIYVENSSDHQKNLLEVLARVIVPISIESDIKSKTSAAWLAVLCVKILDRPRFYLLYAKELVEALGKYLKSPRIANVTTGTAGDSLWFHPTQGEQFHRFIDTTLSGRSAVPYDTSTIPYLTKAYSLCLMDVATPDNGKGEKVDPNPVMLDDKEKVAGLHNENNGIALNTDTGGLQDKKKPGISFQAPLLVAVGGSILISIIVGVMAS